jgi:hypothetical protein
MATQAQLEELETEIIDLIDNGQGDQYFELHDEDEIVIVGTFTLDQILSISRLLLRLEGV